MSDITYGYGCPYCGTIFDFSDLHDDVTYDEIRPLLDRHYAESCATQTPSNRYMMALVQVQGAA